MIDKNHRLESKKILYILLTLFSGVIEVGAIIYVIKNSSTLWFIPLAALAFQCGNITPLPFRIHPYIRSLVSLITLPLILSNTNSFATLFFYIFCASISIQGIRGDLNEEIKISTFTKRCSHILGFLFSFFLLYAYSFLIFSICIIVTNVLYIFLFRINAKPSLLTITWTPPTKFDLLMTIHQVHYFSYYSIVPYLFFNKGHITSFLLCAAFCIGWISYTLTPVLFNKLNDKFILCFGHILVAASLLLMTISQNTWTISACWLVTGFGGGSIFALRRFAKITDSKCNLDLWESLGHILGVFLCVVLIFLFSSEKIPLFFASGIACVTSLISLNIIKST